MKFYLGDVTYKGVVAIDGNSASPGPPSGNWGLYISGADDATVFGTYDAYGNSDAASTGLTFRKARGTAASPSAVQINNLIGQFQSRGFGTTIYPIASSASLQYRADENFTDTAMGGRIDFKTTLNGTLTSSIRLTIKNDGTVQPGADATQTLGTAALRWAAIYAATPAAGTNSDLVATTAYAMAAAPNATYKTILDSSGSHTAARVAGTYLLGQGDPVAIVGTGTLYPINILYIDPADYPTVNGLTTKLRIRATVAVNDVAPTGNYSLGLFLVSRPATSGGAGLNIYSAGAPVTGSPITLTAPAADSMNSVVSAEFAIPAAGFYALGVVTTATVAASSHVHISAALQMRNT